MITQPGSSGFKWLHALGEQLNASGRAERSCYLCILLITLCVCYTTLCVYRLSFLASLLQPESLRQDWLQLALTHDAPQLCDTQTADGQPRSEDLCRIVDGIHVH